jgi:NADPH2:quinone reductase
MKAWLCERFGSIENLVIDEVPSPALGDTQVRVKVAAVPLGFMDTLMVEGLYQLKPALPYTPGAVGAGDVIEVGQHARGVKVGDRVSFLNYFGALAEEAITDDHNAVVLPDGVSYEDGASSRLSYTPAYLALAWRAKLQPGETLLVTGASGGVGHAAVRLGKALDAKVIASVGRTSKMDAVREFGADHVINHAEGCLRDRVKDLTDGKGADVILDLVGGDVFDECIRCINMLGRIVVMGFTSGRIPTIPANLILLKNCTIHGVFLGGWSNKDPVAAKQLNQELLELGVRANLSAHISLRFPFEGARDAMLALRSRETVGKILVSVP